MQSKGHRMQAKADPILAKDRKIEPRSYKKSSRMPTILTEAARL
jgi:hypothetical protein